MAIAIVCGGEGQGGGGGRGERGEGGGGRGGDEAQCIGGVVRSVVMLRANYLLLTNTNKKRHSVCVTLNNLCHMFLQICSLKTYFFISYIN